MKSRARRVNLASSMAENAVRVVAPRMQVASAAGPSRTVTRASSNLPTKGRGVRALLIVGWWQGNVLGCGLVWGRADAYRPSQRGGG